MIYEDGTNIVSLVSILKKDCTIVYQYIIEGGWNQYFSTDSVAITYPFNVEKVPDCITVIPFMCFMLPLAFVCDGNIIVNSIDKDFVDSIDDIRTGYQMMYPHLKMGGKVLYKEIVSYRSSSENRQSGLFFSGGADAFCSLLRHIEEEPELISIWGADIEYDNQKGWETVNRQLKKTGKEFGLNNHTVRSNFRKLIDEGLCSQLVKSTGDGWWHGFYSGLPLFGHASILAYQLGLGKVYIASSFSEKMKGMYTCASDPLIDNQIRFCGCRMVHDAYEMERQDKLRYICERSGEIGKNVDLRVCWESKDGKNCCHCEKCYRTIMEIVSEGYDPNQYGFEWGNDNIPKFRKDMTTKIIINQMNINSSWKPIVNNMLKDRESFHEYDWLIDLDWDNFNDTFSKKITRSILARGIRKITRILQIRQKTK